MASILMVPSSRGRIPGSKAHSLPHSYVVCGVATVLLFWLLFPALCAAEKHKEGDSPNALNVMVNAPLKDTIAAVEQVAGEEVINGTQSFQKERNLLGAHRVQTSKAFGDPPAQGTIFYKVAESVLSPTNFKNSADMGTLTVRYVVSAFDDKNTNLRIDAVFIENSSRKVHESDGSVESAEFGEVRQEVEKIAAQREIEKAEEERIARERKEKQAELDLASRQDAVKANAATMSVDLEQRVTQLRKQAELRVKASGTNLKSAPYKSAASLQALAPYTDVVVLIVTPYWYGVQTADGHRGWVHRASVETLP